MRKAAIAMGIIMVWSSGVMAAEIGNVRDRVHLRHSPSEKSVIVKIDLSSGKILGLRDTAPYESVVDTNPVKALQGTYAVFVCGNGESFIMPAPAVSRAANMFVVIPYAFNWDVQTVTIMNLPGRDGSPNDKPTLTIDGDILLSKLDITLASAPSSHSHRLYPRLEWCFLPEEDISSFPTSDGGWVCIDCLACSDGSQEICGSWYRCG